MNRTEIRWLLAGLLIGGIAAVSIFIGRAYMVSRQKPPAVAAQAMPDTSVTAQGEPQTSDSRIAVELSEAEQKMIGVQTVEVQRQTIRKEIAAPGKVAEPETGIGAVSARIGGRIDKLLVNVTGESVARGQTVALIYSPEVFTAGEEYKLALENRQRLSASKEEQAITAADELVRASRRRLELWALTGQQIDEIASSSEPSIQIAIYSPMSGIVTKRNVAEGQYVKPGDVLFEVADLSTVWVQAGIFESDIPLIRNRQTAKITAPTLLGSDVAAVPRSAVLETGKEKVVYVAKGNGVFEKRSVEGSGASDEYYAVTKGVEPGERVVTHGNFLIDSQTRLTGNITGMFGGSKAFGTEAPPAAPEAKYTVALRSEPSPPKGGSEGTFHVTVTGPDGKPVSDAQVQVTLVMPAMPAMGMGEMRSSVRLAWNGSEYTGSGPVAMAGPWNVTVEARRGGDLLGVYRARFDAK